MYTRPPHRNTNTLTTRLLSGPGVALWWSRRRWQCALRVRWLNATFAIRAWCRVTDAEVGGGRRRLSDKLEQDHSSSEGSWAGRQAHTEPTRRGKWLNTPRTSNDFFYNFNSPSSAHTTPTLLPQYNSRPDRFFFKHMWQLSGSRPPLIEECTANVSV